MVQNITLMFIMGIKLDLDKVLKRIAQVVILSIGLFVVWIINEENKPEYQVELVDTGVVIDTGCVNGSYKGRTTYDCSVDIDWENGGLERRVIKFGVLPNDSIGKWCGTRHWQEYRCQYGRL